MTIKNEIKAMLPTAMAILPSLLVEGSTGIMLAGLITCLDMLRSQRAKELIDQTFNRLDVEKLDKNFLESEEFLEIFQRCIEIVIKTASDNKRKLIADYLSGVIQTTTITDIHGQLLEDLNALQEFHLQVLVTLPDKAWTEIQKSEQLNSMPDYIFQKAISDLKRFGFVRDRHIDTIGGGSNWLDTTEYLVRFKEIFRNINE